jgi:hypothetical protein
MRHSIFVLAIMCAACGRQPERPHAIPLQPQCDFVNYHRDETVNVQGPGRCSSDCDCDGMRSCKEGVCTGEARPIGTDRCDDPTYRWNEAWNGGGSGVCANDCECDGTRSCVNGRCQDRPAHPAGDSALTR